MRYPILTLLTILLASACDAFRHPIVPPLDANFSAQIHLRYEALPNGTKLYFQGGERIDEKDLDRWTTYCSLRVFNNAGKAGYLTSVMPGSFDISAVRTHARSSDGVNYPQGLQMFLGFGLTTSRSASGSGWEPDGPPDYYLYQVEMKLHSTDQPDVRSLTCARKWSTRGDYFPNLADMRQALGSLVLLQPMSISTRPGPSVGALT